MHPNTVHHIKLEAIRLNELDRALPGAQAIEERIAVDHGSFQDKLQIRTDYLAETLGLQRATEQLSSRLKLAGLLTCLICIGLGCIAAINAFDSQDRATVNFYWLILVLTGFNMLSMIVWLSALMLNYRSRPASGNVQDQAGTLFYVVKWLMNLTARANNNGIEATTLQAWVRVYNESGLSKWSLSQRAHLFWLCYLSGGLLMVLIMLSIREYNFGWATTILKPETFVGLTQLLSSVPDALGLNTPDRAMIETSRLDTMINASASLDREAAIAARNSWATLLISSLIFYGLLPRLGLLLFCQWKVKKIVRYQQPDFSQPYFLDLRHRLMPVTRSLGVIDADDNPTPTKSVVKEKPAAKSVPEGAHYLSIELAGDKTWPPADIDQEKYLGDANDFESQQLALAAVASLDNPLVCVVSLMRSPDRGTARLLKALLDQCPTPVFLMIYGEFSKENKHIVNESPAGLRLGDWHRLATDLKIPESQLVHRLRYEGKRLA